MLRLALIGCGAHAEQAHASPLANFVKANPGKVELAGACDVQRTRAEDFCRRFGFTSAFTDWREMLERLRPDGVFCIVPPALLADVGGELLRRGVPSVIEKPLGTTRDQARTLERVAAETGTPHMVSVNRRFVPRINQAAAWADERGPLQYLRVTMLRHRRDEPTFLVETGLHVIDAIRHIAGDVVEHQVRAVKGDWRLIDLRFASGAVGRIDMLTTTGAHAENYELFGQDYRVELRTRLPTDTYQHLQCWQDKQLVVDEQTSPAESPETLRGETGELAEFIAALKERRPPRPAIADVLPSMELCFDLHEAACR